MMRWTKWAGALALTCCAATSMAKAAGADRTGTVHVGGHARTFTIHVPDSAPPAGGFPVILAFHGGGMQGAGMERISGLDSLADSQGFIAIYPDGIDKHWNDGRATIKNPQDDVGFVTALLDQVQRSYPTNRKKVFATGISNGALFTERLACDLSQRIAGIAPVAGSLPEDTIRTCRPSRKVAVLQIDGTGDPIMPYGGGSVKDFGGRGEGGRVTSVAETGAFWARSNGCGSREAVQPLPRIAPFDPTRLVRTRYAACPAGGQVTILSVTGGGHVWPGGRQAAHPFITGRPTRQLDASAAITDFFLSPGP